jgi:hypothetical protein
MSHAHPNSTYDRDREHKYRHDDRHPALTPLVIDLIPDQTRAELEAVIDEPLAIEREAVWDNREEAGPFIGPKGDDREEMKA